MIKLLSKTLRLKHVYVVGINYSDDGISYRLLSIKDRASHLHIDGTCMAETLDQLKQKITKKSPVILVVQGKGVLYKVIEYDSFQESEWFRSLDLEAISFVSYQFDSSAYIAFCRKTLFHDFSEWCKKERVEILDIHLGSLIGALPLLDENEKAVVSGDLYLQLQGGEIIDLEKTHDKMTYSLQGTQIDSDTLPLYAASIQYYTQAIETIGNNGFKDNVEEWLYKKAFEKLGTFMLVFFFVSLLGSYIGIQYLLGQNAKLGMENLYFDKNFREIKILEKKKEEKEKIISESGLFSDKFLTQYAYDILKDIPPTITLDELKINPLVGEVDQRKMIILEYRTVFVKGVITNEPAFNGWIKTLKQIEWLKKLEIESLSSDKNANRIFVLKIHVK